MVTRIEKRNNIIKEAELFKTAFTDIGLDHKTQPKNYVYTIESINVINKMLQTLYEVEKFLQLHITDTDLSITSEFTCYGSCIKIETNQDEGEIHLKPYFPYFSYETLEINTTTTLTEKELENKKIDKINELKNKPLSMIQFYIEHYTKLLAKHQQIINYWEEEVE